MMRKSAFLNKYEEISSTSDFKGKFDKSSRKVCRFCGKNSNETTFLNIPHVLPELLGKNNYTSNDECDVCNELFGYFETDLSNYISPYQTLIGQRTKKKVPQFQSRKQRNSKSTIIKNIEGNVDINFNNNISDFLYDFENKQLNLNLKKKKYVPINVYKSLVKIGLSLCPINELKNFRKTIEWILKNDISENLIYDIPLTLFRTRFLNKLYKNPTATLYKRNTEIINNKYEPKLCLVVCSGVLTFQIFIPFCLETENMKSETYELINELYPAFIYDIDFEGKENITIKTNELPILQYNMNFYGQVEEDEIIQLKYDKINRK